MHDLHIYSCGGPIMNIVALLLRLPEAASWLFDWLNMAPISGEEYCVCYDMVQLIISSQGGHIVGSAGTN